MLHAVISEVLNEVLGADIGLVECGWLDSCSLDLLIDKIPYEDFVQKTKHFISENDIVSHNEESKFVLVVTINLTDEFIHKIMSYVNPMVIREFEEMKKSR